MDNWHDAGGYFFFSGSLELASDMGVYVTAAVSHCCDRDILSGYATIVVISMVTDS
jgi:hypothetical protein